MPWAPPSPSAASAWRKWVGLSLWPTGSPTTTSRAAYCGSRPPRGTGDGDRWDGLRDGHRPSVFPAPPALGGRGSPLPALGIRGVVVYTGLGVVGGGGSRGAFAPGCLGLPYHTPGGPHGHGVHLRRLRAERSASKAKMVAHPLARCAGLLYLGGGVIFQPGVVAGNEVPGSRGTAGARGIGFGARR